MDSIGQAFLFTVGAYGPLVLIASVPWLTFRLRRMIVRGRRARLTPLPTPSYGAPR